MIMASCQGSYDNVGTAHYMKGDSKFCPAAEKSSHLNSYRQQNKSTSHISPWGLRAHYDLIRATYIPIGSSLAVPVLFPALIYTTIIVITIIPASIAIGYMFFPPSVPIFSGKQQVLLCSCTIHSHMD